ncbi:MAG TPA: hypothetical protein VFQ54_07400, partial [Thermomicrobiales bacterium]|nr:hypothetical protein [Thermomicrobiales bacterium]
MTEATINPLTSESADGEDAATTSVESGSTPPPVVETWEEIAAPTAAEATSTHEDPFTTPYPVVGSPEVSPDGRRIAYLLTDGDGATGLWLSPTDGGDAVKLEIPFVPIEDVDPDTGRIQRGPQWSPDGLTIAVAGTHPEAKDRTAIWLVPVQPLPAPVVA